MLSKDRPALEFQTGTLLGRLRLRTSIVEHDIAIISEPQSFAGGEEDYDSRIGFSHNELRSGQGAWRLACGFASRAVEDVLEIGAGGGACSMGLLVAAKDARVLITDTSPAFLRMIQRKLENIETGTAEVGFATLAGEELARLPDESFDAIIVASAVHHVADWRAMLKSAASVLRPGGVFLMQEPFREGYLIMAMILDFVLSTGWVERDRLSPDDESKIRSCRDSIYYLANSHEIKIGEDKHNFVVDEVISAAHDAGFSETAVYVNSHFADLPEDLSVRRNGCILSDYLSSFLSQHHRVSYDGLLKIFVHMKPAMAMMDQAFQRGDGPALVASVAMRK